MSEVATSEASGYANTDNCVTDNCVTANTQFDHNKSCGDERANTRYARF